MSRFSLGTALGAPAIPLRIRQGLVRLDGMRRSLRFRLSVGLILALGATLMAFVVVHYEGHRRRTLVEARAGLSNVGQLIEGSLEYAMLSGDASQVQRILDNEARQHNIRTIVLLNNRGEIRFAPQGQGVGTYLDLPGSRASSGVSDLPEATSTTITSPQGEPVLRYYNPIRNQPSCQTCHDQAEPFAGALVTDFSLADTDAHLRAELRTNLAGGAFVIVVAALIVNLFLDRLVIGRLDGMMSAIRRFGSGDRTQRVPALEADEIGRLAAVFNEMADGLQAKEQEAARLYSELQQEEAIQAQLLYQCIRAQEEERKRIARELHDDFAQTLAALALGLETALHALPPEQASLRRQLHGVRDLTDATLSHTHRWIQDLRPLVLDDLGLVPAIRWYAETWLENNGVDVNLDVHGLKRRLSPELETTLFRVVQEALNNVAKHARASAVSIRLALDDGFIVAEIVDDGVGFDPRQFQAVDENMRGAGLLGMRERVMLVGGELTLVSEPGSGTRIRIEVPWTP